MEVDFTVEKEYNFGNIERSKIIRVYIADLYRVNK